MHFFIYCQSESFDRNYKKAIDEFTKRLCAYCSSTLHLSQDLSFPRDCSKENHLFFQVLSGNSTYTSEEFALKIRDLQQSGKSNIHICIGYTTTEFYEALQAIKYHEPINSFSLTSFTLPNEAITLMLFEQLYRGYTILQGKTYHK